MLGPGQELTGLYCDMCQSPIIYRIDGREIAPTESAPIAPCPRCAVDLLRTQHDLALAEHAQTIRDLTAARRYINANRQTAARRRVEAAMERMRLLLTSLRALEGSDAAPLRGASLFLAHWQLTQLPRSIRTYARALGGLRTLDGLRCQVTCSEPFGAVIVSFTVAACGLSGAIARSHRVLFDVIERAALEQPGRAELVAAPLASEGSRDA